MKKRKPFIMINDISQEGISFFYRLRKNYNHLIKGFSFDNIDNFKNFNKEFFEEGNYTLWIGSVYDILWTLSLIRNFDWKVKGSIVSVKDKISTLHFPLPLFTPNFEELFYTEWIEFINKIINLFDNSIKVSFSIYTINQLEYIKKKIEPVLCGKCKDIFIQFDSFFYNQSTDPMFYMLYIPQSSPWHINTYEYYKKEVERYGYIPNGVETFFLSTKREVLSFDEVVNDAIKNDSIPYIYYAPKVIYSFTLRLFQITKELWFNISSLYDPVLLTKNKRDEKILNKEIFDWKFDNLYWKLDLWKITKILLKQIADKREEDLIVHFKNNYQYYIPNNLLEKNHQ